MNGTRQILSRMAPVFAIAFILSADGLMCGAYAQQLDLEPSLHSPGPESPRLTLSSVGGQPFSRPDGTGMIDLVLKEAFGRVGIVISIIFVPAERALLNVNEGIEDGNFLRIAGMSEKYPGLVQVPEKLVDWEFVAFSRKVDAEMKGWKSLQPYDVAIITGWKILEENVRDTRSLSKVRDQHVLFSLLASDRVDIVVYSGLGGVFTIKEMGINGIKSLQPPLASREMFLYLNRKHTGLVAPVTEALRKMKEDGAYLKIVSRFTQP